MRLNNSSTQVYMALKPDELIDESTGDLLFSSTAPLFRTELLLSAATSPAARIRSTTRGRAPRAGRGAWSSPARTPTTTTGPSCPKEEYEASKQDLVRDDARRARQVRAGHPRASSTTSRRRRRVTFEHYTQHINGASFGTKFEGLAVSRALPQQISGLYHAGSVGIIMSGWLGAMNYGVIVANEVDSQLMAHTPLLANGPATSIPA